MGVLKELKELVRDMGGNAANARTVSQAIDKIPASGGSGGSALLVNIVVEQGAPARLDKTAGEIISAYESGSVTISQQLSDSMRLLTPIHDVTINGEASAFTVTFEGSNEQFTSTTMDAYPVMQTGGNS